MSEFGTFRFGDRSYDDNLKTVVGSGPAFVRPDIEGGAILLEADQGVVYADDGVTPITWLDQSPLAKDMSVIKGAPMVTSPSGAPVFNFDVAYANREIVSTDLPLGLEDRTMFFAVAYNDPTTATYAGFVYGDPSSAHCFGPARRRTGNSSNYGHQLVLQGWGPDGDELSSIRVEPGHWLIQSVRLSAGFMQHYMDGVEIDSASRAWDTIATRIRIGQNINTGNVPMHVGAALLFDRALSDTEHAEMVAYLQEKYITGTYSSGGGGEPVEVDPYFDVRVAPAAAVAATASYRLLKKTRARAAATFTTSSHYALIRQRYAALTFHHEVASSYRLIKQSFAAIETTFLHDLRLKYVRVYAGLDLSFLTASRWAVITDVTLDEQATFTQEVARIVQIKTKFAQTHVQFSFTGYARLLWEQIKDDSVEVWAATTPGYMSPWTQQTDASTELWTKQTPG